MKIKKYVLLISLLVIVLGTGAVIFAGGGFSVNSAYQLGKKASENAADEDKSKVLAAVGGKEIYQYDIDNRMMANEYQMKLSTQISEEISSSQNGSEDKMLSEKQLKDKALDSVIRNKLIYLKCETLGIYPSREEASRMWEITEQTLKEALDSENEISREKASQALNTMKGNQAGLGLSDNEYNELLVESYRELLCSERLENYYINNVNREEYETYEAYLESLKEEFEVIYY